MFVTYVCAVAVLSGAVAVEILAGGGGWGALWGDGGSVAGGRGFVGANSGGKFLAGGRGCSVPL